MSNGEPLVKALELKAPPLLVIAVAAGLMWALAWYAPLVLITFAGQTLIAALIAILGVQMAIAGVRACHAHETTINPLKPEESSNLITDGIFKFTRNPIYLGLLVMLIGLAIWLGALTPLIVLPLFVWYLGRFQIVPEERSLQAQFGDEYRNYCKQTRRWL